MMMETSVSVGSVLKRSLRKKSGSRNYDDKLMDELIDKHIGRSLRKRNRTKEDMEKETKTEAMIALSLGLPIDALLEDEIKDGVVSTLGGKEQNDYIVVRNHILAMWREDVQVWLSKGQIKESVSSEYEHLISSAYEFLLCNGYINFGVSPSFKSHLPEVINRSVIIVGAGLAGLAAARQLVAFGFNVLILEGRNRPGGRVYTQKMGFKDSYVSVDLGGSVITGIHANPLGVLARQLSIPLHKVRDKCPLYRPDGSAIDKAVDSKVEVIFNKLLDKVTQLRQILGGFANNISLGSVLETLRQLYAVARNPEEMQLLNWHLANLEYANAGCLSDLSATYWDQDDPFEMGGDHCFLAGGNWRVIKALCDGIPIFYGKNVDTIKYGERGVDVIAGSQVFQADMVLCTVPLGVLKKRVMRFEPELPKQKLDAIERLGFGLLNKVAMVFPCVFWGEDIDTFGCLSDESNRRGEYFLFYSYHTVCGAPVLTALVAGEAAHNFEQMDPSTSLHRVLNVLKGIYKPKGIEVPDPVQTICTRWGSDPFSYGSYSNVRVRSSGKDYDTLAQSVGNRLFFAGEATNRQYPATMHGAFLSGLREASYIYRAAMSHENPSRSIQKSHGSSDVLCDLFRRPDMKCGRFSFVFDPLCEDAKSMGIMRVGFGGWDDEAEELELYMAVSREQAREAVVRGGEDEEKVLMCLLKVHGLKVMGVNGLGEFGNSVAMSIANARKAGRGRNRVGVVNNQVVSCADIEGGGFRQ